MCADMASLQAQALSKFVDELEDEDFDMDDDTIPLH